MAAASQPGNTVLFLNLPQKTFVGINLTSFNSSPNFHGIVNLPVGLHFLYTGTDATLSIRHGQWLRFRQKTTSPQTHVLRWNHDNESLDLLDPNEHAAKSAINAIPSLRNRSLVDYIALQEASSALQKSQSNSAASNTSTTKSQSDDSETDPWPILTSYITSRTLHRILSPSSTASVVTDQKWTISSVSSSPQDAESIPGLTHAESTSVFESATSTPTLNVLPINLKQTWPTDAVGRDRTEKARDRSWYLSHLIDTLPGAVDGDVPIAATTTTSTTTTDQSTSSQNTARQTNARELLAELQFCFLMVLTLANYSCLEQWKRILGVVLTCESALTEVEGYFVEVLQILRAQLRRVEDVEGGLFELGDEVGSQWLRNLLQRFRKVVDEVFPVQSAVDGAGGKQEKEKGKGESLLKEELVALEEWLREEYGWENYDDGKILRRGMLDLEDGERVEVQIEGVDEEEESGEYAPVVVEM